MATNDSTTPLKCCTKKELCVHPDGCWQPCNSTHFRPAKGYKGGLRSICRACDKAYMQEYRQTDDFKIAERKRGKVRRQNPKYKAFISAYGKTYRNNPEHVAKEKLRKSTSEYMEKARQHNRARRQTKEYREYMDILLRSRRTQVKSLPTTLTIQQWRECLDYWEHSCAYCGSTKHIEMDHFVPVTSPKCLGTVANNIIPACKSCNSSKQNKDALTWLTDKYGQSRALEITSAITNYFLRFTS
jgi:5-methylcytosine-specific restriction endonuclease McrA